MIITVSNLFPYPDQPLRGLFNAQLFRELAATTEIRNLALVAAPPWKHRLIRQWVCPTTTPSTRYIPYTHVPLISRNVSGYLAASALRAETRPYRDLGMDRPDAVLASWIYPDGIAVASVFRNTGIPVWIMALGSDRFHLQSGLRRWGILKSRKNVAGWICVSQNIADDLITGGIPAKQVHVIPNGVDTCRFHRIPQHDARQQIHSAGRFCFEKNCNTLLWIGNLEAIKVPHVAIQALAILIQRQRSNQRFTASCRLVIIGDGSLRSSMTQLATTLGVSDHIFFAGRLDHSEISLWLNASDGLILTSKSEGMPNAVAEALACGCPVTATDVGACREMLADQPCCHIVPLNNVQSFSEAIQKMLIDSTRSSNRPVFKRTWQDMANDVITLITAERHS